MIRKSEFAQSFDDLVAEAQTENVRRDVEGHLKEYAEQSVHEGTEMSAYDFAAYLEFMTTPEHLKA
jgi:hypothetical protein